MENTKLLKFIKSIATNKKSEIGLDTLLFDEKVLNSMNILNLMGYVEKKLGRRLTDNEIVMSNFRSARKILRLFSKNES